MTIELDREAFTAHLRAMEPEAVAGMRCEDGDCPFARFLGKTAHHVSVGGDLVGYADPDGNAIVDTPEWLSQFILDVDTDTNGRSVRTGPITARECLEILEGIPS